MRFHVLTLFPGMVLDGLNTSVIGRAVENRLIEIHAVDIRDFTQDKHGKVDDYTYGGGAGMLMQAQPVYDAWKSVQDGVSAGKSPVPETGGAGRLRTVYVTPQGQPFTQSRAMELAQEEDLVILCGHYEGIDARALEEIVTDYISIGDYVLTGGELPAMVMIDAISRLVPGVLHNGDSAETESFHRYLLEYPQYSRPEVWHGKSVPGVLFSGDHKKVSDWRLEQSVALTKERRPDLYARYQEQENLLERLARDKRHNLHMMESLARGRGEILRNDGDNVLIYDRGCRLCMITAKDEAEGRRLLSAVPKETKSAVASQEFLAKLMRDELGFEMTSRCLQACCTQKKSLRVRHKDIRVLGREYLPRVAECCGRSGTRYPALRMEPGALYGAFVEERLVGFAGWYSDGSLGMLYVEEDFRRQGFGASLEAFCINRQLEMGYTPYGQICEGDEASVRLQEHLGLYLSRESLWRLER